MVLEDICSKEKSYKKLEKEQSQIIDYVEANK
jgi:hypothetical protein